MSSQVILICRPWSPLSLSMIVIIVVVVLSHALLMGASFFTGDAALSHPTAMLDVFDM